jgi:hypothetical protein
MNKHRSLLVTLVAVVALLSGVAASFADAPTRRYLRFVDEPGRQRLETSIIKLENKDGVTVDLVGAVHIADAPYYTQLNERFKNYDAVLYEMVKPKEVQNVGDRAGKSNSWIAILQRFMKNQLELSYQLDKVDYTAKNFVHADLDAETFAKKQEEQGESMLSMMLTSMMREFAKSPQERLKNEVMVEDFLNAIQAPDSERQLKLVLARQFENMEESMDAFGGDDSVIIGERNKKALQVLRDEMEAGKKKLAIFYGAGHLKGMEELMTTLMGFKAVGEPEWLEAWDLSDAADAPRKAPPPLPSTPPATVHP